VGVTGKTLNASTDRVAAGAALDAAASAARALAARNLIGTRHLPQSQYDALTGVWRKTIGPIHPDDASILTGRPGHQESLPRLPLPRHPQPEPLPAAYVSARAARGSAAPLRILSNGRVAPARESLAPAGARLRWAARAVPRRICAGCPIARTLAVSPLCG